MLYNVRLGILHAHYDYCQQFLNSLIFDLNKTPQCSGGNTNSCHWISDSGHDFGTLMSLINVTSPFIGIMNYILPIANTQDCLRAEGNLQPRDRSIFKYVKTIKRFLDSIGSILFSLC